MSRSWLLILLSLSACSPRELVCPFRTGVTAPEGMRLVVIGDYGDDSRAERDVASLVQCLDPELVATVGDNTYLSGPDAFELAVGKHYHRYIGGYDGPYGDGPGVNRFFPALGNHDWDAGIDRYTSYFALPGNERYYDVESGPVHLFILDSDPREPDGVDASSAQARWLEAALASSAACWRIVLTHHAPYSSSSAHGSVEEAQWPYAQWGADLVLAGHDHTYERIHRDGIVYVVNGLGGRSRYGFDTPVAGSVFRYDRDYGALLLTAAPGSLTLQFYDASGGLVDEHTLTGDCPP